MNWSYLEENVSLNSQESKIMCHKSTDLLLSDYYSTVLCLCLDVVIITALPHLLHFSVT